MLRTDFISTAMRYREAGLSVIPVRADGSKAPALKEWTSFQHHLPSEDELRQWFGNGVKRGVAVVCGAVSGNLAVLDFDDEDAYIAFGDLVVEHGLQTLVSRLPCAKTPGGYHYYLRTPEPLATQVLARGEDGSVLVEVRGEGAYAIVPPSPAEVHPDGKPYELLTGDLCAVPQLTAEEVEDILSLVRALNRKVEPAPQVLRVTGDAKRVGDRYNEQADVLTLLQQHGWKVYREGRDGNLYLTRPGKERGVSASWHEGLRMFYVFSTNAPPFEAGRAYSPFAIYALLEHGGDFSAAAKGLAQEAGDGQREKWRTRADYRQRTIQTALQSLHETYTGGHGNGQTPVLTKFMPRRFSERILQEHCFVSWGDLKTGDFLRYDPDAGIWREDAEAFIANLLREGNLLPEEWKTQARVMEIVNDIRQWCWQPDPMPEPPLTLIPFANGVLDLDTGDLRPYRPEDGFRNKLHWDYNPDAQSHVLAKRLHAVPEGIRQHFFELLAYCLWRAYPFQRFFVWVGRGGNGKSYLLRLLTLALGSENVSNVGLHALGEDRFAKAELHGKLLNISGEMRYEDITDTDALKALTGGDHITADRKYKSPITFQNHAKVLFAGNTLPVTRDTTDAFFRRAYVVEFEHQFREDPRVENELALLPLEVLAEEFSWLLTQAVRVLQELRARGFVFSHDLPVEEKRKRYLALSHPLRQFIAENCEVTRRAEDFIYKWEFQERLNEWLEQRGFNAYTETRLGREMREVLGFEDAQRGEKKWRAWIGIQWADTSHSHSSQGSHPFETLNKETKSRFEKPCEPCECAPESPPSFPPQRARMTPLGFGARAIETVLSGGKRMSKRDLHRATGLPPSVFEEALQHMLHAGQLIAEAGAYELQEVMDDG
jgi:P4 family phage/plasmid primase-like protien